MRRPHPVGCQGPEVARGGAGSYPADWEGSDKDLEMHTGGPTRLDLPHADVNQILGSAPKGPCLQVILRAGEWSRN